MKQLLLSVVAAALITASVVLLSNREYEKYDESKKIRLGGIPWNFTNCGSEADPLVITSIVFSSMPERAAPPNIVAITGSMQLHKEFVKMLVQVKFTGVQVFSQGIEYKSVLDPGDMLAFKYSFSIPGIAPAGSYEIVFKFLTQSGEEASCNVVQMEL